MGATLLVVVLAAATLSGTAIGSAPEAHSASEYLQAVKQQDSASAPVPQAPSSSCDSNYSGACVPVARDVDCSGGSGNGPAYVSGPVTVIGDDIYGLDRDGYGDACDS